MTPEQQTGSVALCSTGWDSGRRPTPEECEEAIEKNADDIKELKQKLEKKIYKTEEDIKELKEDVKKLDKDVYYIIKTNKKKPETIRETKDFNIYGLIFKHIFPIYIDSVQTFDCNKTQT